MKVIRSFLVVVLVVAGMICHGQIPENVKSYAVIGVFKLNQNATKFAEFYKSKSLATEVRKNQATETFYVFVEESEDVEYVRSKVLDLREQFERLGNAWLYNGNFNCLHIPSDQLTSSRKSSDQLVSNNPSVSSKDSETISIEDIEDSKTPVVTNSPLQPKVEKPQGKFWIYFNTYNETDLGEVPGHVKMQDMERLKELGKYPTQELVTLNDPNNGTRKVKFETDIFGFRVEERLIDLDDPMDSESKEFLELTGDSIIVDVALKRYNKGDYMTMWNVYFYIDAAIMKEESVLELNQLLNLMRENETIRIKIHGHTNGNSKGVVKHLDLDDKSFFSLNGSHLEDRASAKKLSEFRAYTIQHWLMDQGIEENRMEIEGWGGKKMIYDKHSSNADKNVRVEIEILEE